MVTKIITRPIWTEEKINERLQEAAETLRRLPRVHIQARMSYWPDIVRSSAESYGWDNAYTRPAAPSPEAISRMDETLGWLLWLEEQPRRIIWARACKMAWRRIEDMDGRCHVTLRRVCSDSIDTIRRRLNAAMLEKVRQTSLKWGGKDQSWN